MCVWAIRCLKCSVNHLNDRRNTFYCEAGVSKYRVTCLVWNSLQYLVCAAHACLVEENAPKMVAIWEYVSLAGEVSTAAVDDVDAWKAARSCDFLQPQMLLRRVT